MDVNEIKQAVDDGKKVFWGNDNYEVIKGASGYLIKSKFNNHCIGLTWLDGVTLNGKEEEFFIEEPVILSSGVNTKIYTLEDHRESI